jgi:ADP-heptose:LPS heptosyltransferase
MSSIPNANSKQTSNRSNGAITIVVLIFQGLGDVVLATPALRAVRQSFPQARIIVLGAAGLITILRHEKYVDEILPIKMNKGVGLSAIRTALEISGRVRALAPDILIDLTTPLYPWTWVKSRLLGSFCGCSERYGPRLKHIMTWGISREAVSYRTLVHEADLKIQIIENLVVPPRQGAPALSLSSLIPPAPKESIPRIGVAPGAARQSRRWPLERFAAVMRDVANNYAIEILLLGTRAEQGLCSQLCAQLNGHNVTNCSGQLSAEQLPSAIAGLDVLLTNDSGLMHVAAAVDTPLVAILGPESIYRYAPLGIPSRMRFFHRRFRCSPCLRTECSHQSCFAWIEPGDVARCVKDLLQASRVERLGHETNRRIQLPIYAT